MASLGQLRSIIFKIAVLPPSVFVLQAKIAEKLDSDRWDGP
jgi:hypothetical protein